MRSGQHVSEASAQEHWLESVWGRVAYGPMVPQDHFGRALKMLFDWEALGNGLIEIFEERAEIGARPHPPALVFKMLFLS